MKKVLCTIISLLILFPTVSFANEVGSIDGRNEAAGLAGTMKFFVGRMARDCKPLINKDDEWMHSVVSKWMVRNGKYANAAEIWVSSIATAIANNESPEAGQAFAKRIIAVTRMNAELKVSDLLVGSDENKITTCANFENEIVNGMYDITENAPLYDHLEELVVATNTK